MDTRDMTNITDNYNDRMRSALEKHKKSLLLQIQANHDEANANNERLYYENQDGTATDVAKTIIEEQSILFQLVIGMTQTGKTACMIAIIEKIFLLGGMDMKIHPKNIYIITGLSSNDWREQTKDRMPSIIDGNVYHRNDVKKLYNKLIGARDVLIIMDEVHIASKTGMTIDKALEQYGFKDIPTLCKNNINFVEFSATPNRIFEDMKKWNVNSHCYAKYHLMPPGVGYKGFSHMLDNECVFDFKDLYIDSDVTEYMNDDEREKQTRKIKPAMDAIREINNMIPSKYKDDPKYHVIRTPKGVKHTTVIDRFKQICGDDYGYISCHSEENNNLLRIICETPKRHTFIFIKDALRCAVTLKPKKNIGILYENKTRKINDDVIIQSLAGRATGYDVPNDIVVFTNVDSLRRYIDVWCNQFSNSHDISYHGSRSRNTKPSIAHPCGYTNTDINPTTYEDEITVKPSTVDFDYKIFSGDKDEDAKTFAKNVLGKKMNKTNEIAPKDCCASDGSNPTIDMVTRRKWGLNKKCYVRKIRLNTGEICVYWKPSYVPVKTCVGEL